MTTKPKAYKSVLARHKAAGRALLYALGLMESWGWQALKHIIMNRLDQREIACLAFAALRALDEEERKTVIEMSCDIDVGAGVPMPPLGEVHDDAKWWASIANQKEHEAYLMAAYNALPKKSQQELRAHLKGKW
tara:strand:- start:3340 stop:3741 length:402 start_codon:yes stop_codon:yes gene_type:complete